MRQVKLQQDATWPNWLLLVRIDEIANFILASADSFY
jgi:hypothetical protein